MSTNVIDASSRFKGASDGDRKRPSPIQRATDELRALARVPLPDRPILAKGLGRLAALVSSASPKKGAEAMFEKAGLQAKWPKRKRLLRLLGEPAEPTSDHGKYEGNGPAYLALADAAAELMAGSPIGDRDLERVRRDLLRGTSLLPEATPLTASETGARDLLVDWGERLCARIKSTTRLAELSDVLHDSPFTTQVVDETLDYKTRRTLKSQAEVISSVMTEPAGEAAMDATLLVRPRWKEHVKLRFISNESENDLSWANPLFHLGRLAGRVTVPTFILPPAHAALIGEPQFTETERALPEPVRDWLMSIGCKGLTAEQWRERLAKYDGRDDDEAVGGRMLGKLPTTAWTPSTGWGWKDLEYYRVANVWVEIRPKAASGYELIISVSGHGNVPEIAPFIPAFGTNPEATLKRYFSDRGGDDFEAAYYHGMDEEYMVLHWPQPKTDDGTAGGKLIGLLENYSSGEPFEEQVEGWLDDPEIAALVLTADRWRFFPEIDCPSAPVPCASRSIAAALLRNLAGASQGSRVNDLLVAQAEMISNTALAYHEAVVGHYRKALE